VPFFQASFSISLESIIFCSKIQPCFIFKIIIFLHLRHVYCTIIFFHNLSHYSYVLLQIMGKWYVVEILEHRLAQKLISNSYVVNSCPIVNLRSPSDPASLKLLWTEEAGSLEYIFRIPDIGRRKGYWRSIGVQNGKVPLVFTWRSDYVKFIRFALIRPLFLRRSIDPFNHEKTNILLCICFCRGINGT